MSITHFRFICTLVLSFASIGHADDWPQYRGPFGDGKSTEAIDSAHLANVKSKQLWKVPTTFGFSSFAIADGRAFTLVAREKSGSKLETCLALDAISGQELWSVPLGKSDYNSGGGNSGAPGNRGGDGPRSTPSTDGDHVYIYDAHLVLSCLNASNGALVWKRDVVKEFAGRNIKWLNATSPLLNGQTLYVGGGGVGQSFLAFNKSTGDVLWKSGDEKITHATPHLTTIGGKKQLIFFAQSGLVSVNPANGKERWRRKFKYQTSSAASPVTEGNLVYCSAGYGVGAGLFKVIGQREAKKVWLKPNKLMNHWSTPVIHDGHLYGIFEFKKYGRAPLNCVELATGAIKWSKRGFGPGNCILVGDTLVVLTDTGEIVLVEASPDRYREVSRTKVLEGKCWSTPAFSNGRIYVRSTEEAACLDLGAA